MQTTINAHIAKGSKPCVCKNCVYSVKPKSSRDELLHGSRIDKLYYNKYLPLREKKLLDKLVRTRGVYDNIRNKILRSDTEINKNCGCANKTNVNNAKESYPIYDIVSRVDRGEFSSNSSFNLHSECCSCCDCKLTAIKQPKVHKHTPSPEVVKEYLSKHGGKTIKASSCLCTQQLSSEKNRLKHERKYLEPPLKAEKTKNKKAVNEIKESVHSSFSIMGNKFRNAKDSLTLIREKKKKNKKNDPMEDWACAPDFCIPDHCNPADCYKVIKRRLPFLDHQRKIRFADEKVQTREHDIKNPKVIKPSTKLKRKSKVMKIICKCKRSDVIRSAASMTDMSVPKTTSTKKSSTKTKSVPSIEMQKPRKQRGHICICNNPLPFPRECDPGMCEPGKCNPKNCAKILLRNSQAIHDLDRKRPKKEPPQTSSVECMCEIKQKKQITKIVKETAIQPKKNEKVAKKITARPANVKSVQKDIGRCFCTMDMKKTKEKETMKPKANEPISKSTSSTSVKSLKLKRQHKKIKITSASEPKAVSRNVQTRVPKQRKRLKPAANPEKEEYIPISKSTLDAPTRQVVRVSSSFRFNIELFKEKNHLEANENISRNNIPVLCFCHSSKTKTSSTLTNNAKKLKKQTKAKIERKKLIQRCLCTLALHKKTKKDTKKSGPESTKKSGIELRKEPKMKTKKSDPKKITKYEPDVSRKSIACQCECYVIKKMLPYEEIIEKRKQLETKSLVKCFCTSKLHIKPKREKKEIPVKARKTETQTVDVKQKKNKTLVYRQIKCQCKEPKEPKRLNQKPSKTKKPHENFGRGPPVEGKPSSSSSDERRPVKLGSEVSFSLEFYRNKRQPKKIKTRNQNMYIKQ